MTVKPVPDGFHSVTPYLVAVDAQRLLDFMKAAFDANEVEKIADPSGRIMHAEVKIGDSIIMLTQSSEKWPAMPTMLYVYLEDCDGTFRQAVAAGATSVMEPADQYYGDRNGTVKDQDGNYWCVATRKENLSQEQLIERMKKAKG